MTLGPMPCMRCGIHVWYDHGLIIDRGGRRNWKRHSCVPALASRRYHALRGRKWTPEYRRAYKLEWMRRKRRELAEAGR